MTLKRRESFPAASKASACIIAPVFLLIQRSTLLYCVSPRAPGSNTLLTYLLPDLWYFAISLFGVTWFQNHFAEGTPGVLRTVAFTALMVTLAELLTRLKLRLQL